MSSNDTQALTLLSAGLFSLDRMERNMNTLARSGIPIHPAVRYITGLRRRHLTLLRKVMVGATNPMAPSQIKKSLPTMVYPDPPLTVWK
jgi:hypothetical protein